MNAKTKNRRKGNIDGRGGYQPLRTQPEKVLETDEGHGTIPFLAMYGSRRLIIRSELELWLQNHPHEKEALKNGTYRKTAQEA